MVESLTSWKPDLVELGFPTFLAPLLLILSKENGPKWGTWPTTAPFCPIFVAMLFFITMQTIHIKRHNSGQLVVRQDRFEVKSGVHAADNQACVPQLAPFKLRCYQQLHLGAKLRNCQLGHPCSGNKFQKYPFFRPLLATSGRLFGAQ